MFRKISVFCFIFLLFPSFTLGVGKIKQGWELIFKSLPFVYYNGVVAATLAKENCSCLFVSGLANSGELNKMLDECTKRVTVPLKFVIESGVKVKVVETDRRDHTSPFGKYKVVAENWGLNTPGFQDATIQTGGEERRVNLKILLQRFEAVLDANPLFGCRLRNTYNFYESGIEHIEVTNYQTRKIDGTQRSGNVVLRKCPPSFDRRASDCPIVDIIKGNSSASSFQTQIIKTPKAELPVPENWPKTSQ